jgi:hypothetical protein
LAGRPLKQIDPKAVEALASCGCTPEEISAKLDCSRDTIDRRFADVLKKGQAIGRTSLRGKQFDLAMKGNTLMLIWLGKNLLGQTDKLELTSLPDDDLIAEAKRRIAARLRGV